MSDVTAGQGLNLADGLQYGAVALIGALIGMGELISRYKDDPAGAITNRPAITYMLVNVIASMIALLALKSMPISLAPDPADKVIDAQLESAKKELDVAARELNSASEEWISATDAKSLADKELANAKSAMTPFDQERLNAQEELSTTTAELETANQALHKANQDLDSATKTRKASPSVSEQPTKNLQQAVNDAEQYRSTAQQKVDAALQRLRQAKQNYVFNSGRLTDAEQKLSKASERVTAAEANRGTARKKVDEAKKHAVDVEQANTHGEGRAANRVGYVLLAGFGAMSLLRSSAFNMRVGDNDISVGPSALLQVILMATDRAVDRARAKSRAEQMAKTMKFIKFDQIEESLPQLAFSMMQNVQKNEKEGFKQQIEQLRQAKIDPVAKLRHPLILRAGRQALTGPSDAISRV
ncbi:MAG: hypothetical protein ACJ8AT_05155 [Hyalangium sp.]|uniref:hypothetical protein n=1 Tax=Hyalangium sp. TaxID=2028555 RepID=UPI003899D6CF